MRCVAASEFPGGDAGISRRWHHFVIRRIPNERLDKDAFTLLPGRHSIEIECGREGVGAVVHGICGNCACPLSSLFETVLDWLRLVAA